jgi:hypothetical protein
MALNAASRVFSIFPLTAHAVLQTLREFVAKVRVGNRDERFGACVKIFPFQARNAVFRHDIKSAVS